MVLRRPDDADFYRETFSRDSTQSYIPPGLNWANILSVFLCNTMAVGGNLKMFFTTPKRDAAPEIMYEGSSLTFALFRIRGEQLFGVRSDRFSWIRKPAERA